MKTIRHPIYHGEVWNLSALLLVLTQFRCDYHFLIDGNCVLLYIINSKKYISTSINHIYYSIRHFANR